MQRVKKGLYQIPFRDGNQLHYPDKVEARWTFCKRGANYGLCLAQIKGPIL